jgi:Spy/CpxP family protein refolding chaperone
MTMKNKGKFWMGLSILVIFAAGMASGVFVDKYLLSGRHGRDRRGGPPSIEMMAKDLGLTQDQQDRIRFIFQQSEDRFRELRSNMHMSLSQIREGIKNEIDKILTPEQKEKFEAMLNEHSGQRSRGNETRPASDRNTPPRED